MSRSHQMTTVQLIALISASAAIGASATIMAVRIAPATAHAAAIQTPSQKDDKPAEKQKVRLKVGRPVVHFEIGCRDSAKTRDFYSNLFDWNITDAAGAYNIQTGAGKGIDGHIASLGHDPQHYVTVYVEVDDIKAYLKKSIALGGKTLVPAIPIPTGHFAWLADPDGNIIGLLEPKKK